MIFTDQEIKTLVIIERLGGSLSLISVTSVFLAYAAFPRLRTVPNTFIVFASAANAGASAGSVIAYDGISRGEKSALCQAQGFMFEFFIQSDPWWALAMAINVLLIFFTKTKPNSIKRWGWLYCLLCYGGPFIIALICLQLKDSNKSNVYGNAGLWCWIASDWGPLRFYSYYMLIWFCILASMLIYIGVGIHVFRIRNRLHRMTGPAMDNSGSRGRRSPSTARHRHGRARGGTHIYQGYNGPVHFSTISSRASGRHSGHYDELADGTVNITTEVAVHFEEGRLDAPFNIDMVPPKAAYHNPGSAVEEDDPMPHPPSHPRLETVIASGHDDTAPPPRRERGIRAVTARTANLFDRFTVIDPVKRAYLRTSLLFGISVLVTWIPSSINRIHGQVSSESPYEYNLATATVLPLQGVWNGIIFFVTSRRALAQCLREWRYPSARVVELTTRAKTRSLGGTLRRKGSDETKILGAGGGVQEDRGAAVAVRENSREPPELDTTMLEFGNKSREHISMA